MIIALARLGWIDDAGRDCGLLVLALLLVIAILALNLDNKRLP